MPHFLKSIDISSAFYRACGGIFCQEHSSQEATLNEDCAFDANGFTVRVCDGCYERFEAPVIEPETEESPISATSEESEREQIEPAKEGGAAASIPPRQHRPSVVDGLQPIMSMPTDWSWSSF